MNIEQRQKIERQLIRHLIRVMDLNGWKIDYIDDGGENIKVSTELQALETVFSVDTCHIRFKKENLSHWVFIVLGNDGWDAICDYSYSENDDFKDIIKNVFEYVDYLQEENSDSHAMCGLCGSLVHHTEDCIY